MKTRLTKTKIEKRFDKVRMIPESVNEADRTAELIFTTSSPVRQIALTEKGLEEFNEVLSMDKKSVRLDRMKKGAPLLDSHNVYGGVRAQMGVVEDVWLKGDEMHGRVRFSKRDDVEPYFQDVKDGTLKNASIGYRVYRYEDESKEDDEMRTLVARDWEPFEVSLVTVPADSRAQVKSQDTNEMNEVEIEIIEKQKGVDSMPQENTQTELDKARAEERQKAAKVLRACRQAGLSEGIAEEIIDGGHSYSRALEIVQEKWAEKDAADQTPAPAKVDPTVEITVDEKDHKRSGMVDAIIHRVDPTHKVEDNSKKYLHLSAIELCRQVVKDAGFLVEGKSKQEIIKRAFHSTADFPAILENVASKRIEMGYESVPQVYKQFMSETTLRDFKQTSIAHLDEAPALELLGEGAEIKYGTMGDSKEVYSLATYAKALSVTRQTIINDDLGAFAKVSTAFGRAAAHLENQIALKGQVLDNPNMQDGNALFRSANANLATGAALDEDALSEMKKIMRDQLDSQAREIELTPRFLLVGTDQETAARKLLAAQSNQGGFNVFGNEFQLLVSSLVPDGESYLIADPTQIENVEFAYLEGARGIQVETEDTFDVLGIKIRAYLDFAAKAINHRSMVKNPGT